MNLTKLNQTKCAIYNDISHPITTPLAAVAPPAPHVEINQHEGDLVSVANPLPPPHHNEALKPTQTITEEVPNVTEDSVIQTNYEAIDSFDAMGLPEPLLRGIYAYGFEKPSAIQQRAIEPSMLGRDLIAQAQSGESVEFFYVLCGYIYCL